MPDASDGPSQPLRRWLVVLAGVIVVGYSLCVWLVRGSILMVAVGPVVIDPIIAIKILWIGIAGTILGVVAIRRKKLPLSSETTLTGASARVVGRICLLVFVPVLLAGIVCMVLLVLPRG